MTVKTRLLDRLTSRAWIQADALLRPFRRGWVDVVIILGLGATLFGLLQVARESTGVQRPAIGELSRDQVIAEIQQRLPREDSARTFDTLVGWARFGGLFAYREDTQALSVQ